LNRRTLDMVRSAGFTSVQAERFDLPGFWLISSQAGGLWEGGVRDKHSTDVEYPPPPPPPPPTSPSPPPPPPPPGGIEMNEHSTDVDSPPPPHVCMSNHAEGKSKVMLGSRLECLFSMTLMSGGGHRHRVTLYLPI
jgi:hypothetical protein